MADFTDKIKALNDTPDTTASFSKDDIEKNKAMAILSYIWILFLVPLFAAKDSKFARYHANQGLTLAIVETVVAIVFGILTRIPVIGVLFWIIEIVADLAFIACIIIGIINAANGQAKELPLIGKYTILK